MASTATSLIFPSVLSESNYPKSVSVLFSLIVVVALSWPKPGCRRKITRGRGDRRGRVVTRIPKASGTVRQEREREYLRRTNRDYAALNRTAQLHHRSSVPSSSHCSSSLLPSAPTTGTVSEAAGRSTSGHGTLLPADQGSATIVEIKNRNPNLEPPPPTAPVTFSDRFPEDGRKEFSNLRTTLRRRRSSRICLKKQSDEGSSSSRRSRKRSTEERGRGRLLRLPHHHSNADHFTMGEECECD